MPRRSRHYDAIVATLSAAPGPLSAADLGQALAHTGIGVATVYRLLARGVEEGRFVAVEMPNGAARYEPADRPHHHHFQCTGCDTVFDVPGCAENLKKLVPRGFHLQGHEILLTGTCRDCGPVKAD